MSIDTVAPSRVIIPPSFSPGLIFRSLRQWADFRDLAVTLCLHRIRVRYKQSALGLAWALLQPLSLMGIYTVIFSLVTKIPSNDKPYSVFVYAALLPWLYFSGAVGIGAGSLVSHAQLVSKVYFPREILPFSYVFAAFFDLLMGSTVLAGMMIFYQLPVSGYALWLLPILLVETLFIGGVTLLLSAVQVRFRDIGLALPLVLQLWMFATPVVYPLASIPAWLRPYYLLNPMAGVVENFRRVLIENRPPDNESLLVAAAVSVLLLPISFLYFKWQEATMADTI